MIASYKRYAIIGAAVFVAGGAALGWWNHQYPPESGDPLRGRPLFAALFGIVAVSYWFALYALIRAKGRNGAWVLMGFLNLIGLVVILSLKDDCKNGHPPPPQGMAPAP